jgi:aminomethyltransferase
VFYTALCNDAGGMIDDGTLLRMTPLSFRWIGGSDASILWLQEQAKASDLRVSVRNSTTQVANLALQGRHSRDILGKLFAPVTGRPAVGELQRFRFTVARHGGENGLPVLISRTGFTGELGYEIFCAPRDAEQVFDLIMAEGARFGIAPVGMTALDTLRIEAGLPLAGAEFDGRTTPYDAGIGFTVALNTKDVDFRGREALTKAQAWGRTRLVTLVFDGGEAPLPHAPLRIGMTPVGRLTSITRSPALGKVIALAQIDTPHSDPGTEVLVGALDGAQKQLIARTAPLCVFDLGRLRIQGQYA